jgi:hypothetical protein
MVMLGAIIHWDHKLGHQRHELLRFSFQQYDYAIRAFGFDPVVFVDLIGTLPLLSPPVHIVEHLHEARACFDRRYEFVYMSPHPFSPILDCAGMTDTCFVIGPDYSSLSLPEKVERRRIPMKNNSMELWSHQVLAIVGAKWNGC